MISTVSTTTTTVTTLYLLIWAFIVLLASFVYHYVKIEEYKGTIIGSILIGTILGGVYGAIIGFMSTFDLNATGIPYGLVIMAILISVIAFIMMGVILAFLGGLAAVTLKKFLKRK